MMNIYQLFPRLFGNKNASCKPDGDRDENGCGHFDDINNAALKALADYNITHIWLTGIIRHATMTDYSKIGIAPNHPDVTKGKAGSPYAITDYYDIDPDLATDPTNRMNDFGRLVERIHKHGMKVIIDFVPNHVSRQYKSLDKTHEQFGLHDNNEVVFLPTNNYYYCPNEAFKSPCRTDNIAPFIETPAKATGNNVFCGQPSINDWYDTAKLNYGIDYRDGTRDFSPTPDTWLKMLDIVRYWCAKGVDGFRVDMAEMVPVEFWRWLIGNVRRYYNVVFIAEIYQRELYHNFIEAGFDCLYDKIDFYNTIEQVLYGNIPASSITHVWQNLNGLDTKMLRFMENHDERRLASPWFLGSAEAARPAMALAALMSSGPLMLYNGQACGEPALGTQGYSHDDGRTSIFDYCHIPQLQKWLNNGRFDGTLLSDKERDLLNFYVSLLRMRTENEAFSKGQFYDLMWCNPWYSHFDPQYLYAFLRYTNQRRMLVVVNFNRHEKRNAEVTIPSHALKLMGMLPQDAATAEDMQCSVEIEPSGVRIIEI